MLPLVVHQNGREELGCSRWSFTRIRYKAQTDNQNGREEQCWRLPGSLGGSTLRPAPRLQVRGI